MGEKSVTPCVNAGIGKLPEGELLPASEGARSAAASQTPAGAAGAGQSDSTAERFAAQLIRLNACAETWMLSHSKSHPGA